MNVGHLALVLSVFLITKALAEIKVPAFMNGVVPDKKAKKGEFFVYDVKGRFNPSRIVPKKNANQTLEDLLSSLYYAYSKNDKNFFFTLFSPDALASLKALSSGDFEKIWKTYSKSKEPVMLFYHNHNDGMIIGVRGKGEKNPEIQFARDLKGKWIFDKLKLNYDNPKTNNVGLWMTYLPMKENKASLLTTFKRGDKLKIIEAQVTLPFLALLLKTKDKWQLVGQIKDNNSDYSAWPDLNPAEGMIKINISDFDHPSEKIGEILVIESSYPLTYYPLSLESKGQFTF